MSDHRDRQHARWERTYQEDPAWFGTEPTRSVRWAIPVLEDAGARRVLELGAGHGRDSLELARRGFDVVALDYSRAGLDALAAAAADAGLGDRVETVAHDLREPLPFDDAAFDAAFSHMLFCMDLDLAGIAALMDEVRRVLVPGAPHVYAVRNTEDDHFGTGTPRGGDRYEHEGFVVHFLDDAKVRELAEGGGWELVETRRFEEGELPRRLTWVWLERPGEG